MSDGSTTGELLARIRGGDLTPDKALELHRVVDAHAATLPHEFVAGVYDRLRPLLRGFAPRRRLNARRLFCIPFEDLLSNEDPESKIRRRIARASIPVAWRLVAAELSPADLAALDIDARMSTTLDCEAEDGIGERWWPRFAEKAAFVVERISGDRAYRQSISGLLDRPTRLADIREMAEALENWESIRILRETIPAGTTFIPEMALSQVAGIVNECVTLSNGDIACDVAVARISDAETKMRLCALLDEGRDAGMERATSSFVERIGHLRRTGDWATTAEAIAKAYDRSLDANRKSKIFERCAREIGTALFKAFMDGAPGTGTAGWLRLLKTGLKSSLFDVQESQKIRDFFATLHKDIEARIAETKDCPRAGDPIYFELVRCVEEIAGAAAANQLLARAGFQGEAEAKSA